ncbi:MAG TPA: hypothetical protein VKU40_15610 [Thermoanaerobaculia bacterium]|nr:hypothetical protein [Thermoanaerobaculia bacterium]
MGLFGRNPQKKLDKAAGFLDRGDPVRALEVAIDFVNDKDQQHRQRAKELVERARLALVERGVERSAAAEAEGDYTEAADWLRAAVHHCQDEAKGAELSTRLAAMERLAGEPPAERQAADEGDDGEKKSTGFGLGGGGSIMGGAPRIAFDDASPGAPGEEIDLDTHYDLLLETLVDGVANEYRDRPEPFRRAYVDLNEGRGAEALAAFDALAEEDLGDAVVRFERGRARLMEGDAAGAREDFEAAWEVYGDGEVDASGSLSVPALWAEAALAAGDTEAVAERLADLVDPRETPGLVQLHGTALLAGERYDEALDVYSAARNHHSANEGISVGLSSSLAGLGRRPEAMEVLEKAIAPSCAGGSCNRQKLPISCVRQLIAMHLADATEKGEAPARRAEELFELLAFGVQGRFGAGDLEMMARFHDLLGEEEEAAELRARLVEGAEAAAASASA